MQRSDVKLGQELWSLYQRHNTPEQPDEGIRCLANDLGLTLMAVQQGPLGMLQPTHICSGLMPLGALLGEQGMAKFEVLARLPRLKLCCMHHQAAMSSNR